MFLGCPVWWYIIVYSSFLWALYFCDVSCNVSFFTYNFVDFRLLSFLVSLAKSSSIVFIFSKNQLLVWFIFSIVLLFSVSFISALIFIISLLLLTLGFVSYSFSSSVGCSLRLVIWDFSRLFRWACIVMNFPLRTTFAASRKSWCDVFSFSFVSRYF